MKMKLGFIKPNYPNEKRVALLPCDINGFDNEIVIEKGFGAYLNILDLEYINKGCSVTERQEVFERCDAIFSLKLIQPTDYAFLRDEQMIIGWTHPTGSGSSFMKEQAIPKNLKIVDLDNIYPTMYYKGNRYPLDFIPKNFVFRNSFIAGVSATMHGLLAMGIFPNNNNNVAILSSGNVAQGAYSVCSKLGMNARMFYRKTINEFYNDISNFDIIINGIEMDKPNVHIIDNNHLQKIKKGTLIIDAAADAGNAIEGTHYTSIDNPIYEKNGIFFYEVNNAPSIYYRTASEEISKAFSKYVYSIDIRRFYKLLQ